MDARTITAPVFQGLTFCDVCMPGALFAPGTIGRFEGTTSLTAFTSAQELLPISNPTTFNQIRVSDTLPPIPASSDRIADGEQPRITVVPYDPNSPVPPHMLVGPEGIVRAPGFGDTEGPLANCTIAVMPGARPEDVELAINLTAEMLKGQINGQGIALDDPDGILRSDFRTDFNQRHSPNPDDRLPDNPHMPPDGGGGGGGCRPPNPDAPPDRDHPPDRDDPNNAEGRTRGLQRLEELTRNLTRDGADMHPLHYSNWLRSMLPQSLLDKLAKMGPPPWSPEQMSEIEAELAKPETQQQIAQNLDKEEARLRQQGDTAGADAIGKFKTDLLAALGDPTKRHAFVQALSDFTSSASQNTANPTDILRLFDGNPAVQRAVQHLAILSAATRFDHSGQNGAPDLGLISPANRAAILSRLQARPTGSDDQPTPGPTAPSLPAWLRQLIEQGGGS
jgi:hypothetical protein